VAIGDEVPLWMSQGVGASIISAMPTESSLEVVRIVPAPHRPLRTRRASLLTPG